jgi:hypothetical protein
MGAVVDAASFAWRLTMEGAEAVKTTFADVGRAANANMAGTSSAANVASASLQALSNNLGGVTKNIEGLERLRRELLALAEIGGAALLVETSLKAASNVRKFSDETGFAIGPVQELLFALRQFHVEQDTAVQSMKKFSEETAQFVTHNAGPAKQAYETLFGANAQQIAQQGLAHVDQFFMQVLDRIGKLKNEAQKVELAKEIFGKEAGPELVRAADEGIEKLQELREEAERLGVVFSDDMVNKAEDAEVQIGNLVDLLHKKLAIAIDENADSIAHMAEVAIDLLPAVLKMFNLIADAVEVSQKGLDAIAISLGNAGHIVAKMAAAGMTGSIDGQGGLLDGLADPSSPFNKPSDDLTTGLNIPLYGKGNPLAGESLTGVSTTGVPPIRNDEALSKIKAEQEAYDKLTYSLKQQIAAMGTSDREMFINNEERKLGAQATLAQRQEIEQLAGKLYDEKIAWEALKSASQSAGEAISSAFEDAIIKGKKFHDVLGSLAQTLESIAYKYFVGDPLSKLVSGGLENLFGSVGGSSSGGLSFGTPMATTVSNGGFGGFMADGGDMEPGKWYIAGEGGPEKIRVGGQGATAMGYSPQKSAANVFNVDMRGASVEAVARLEALVKQVNGSIETRALNAVQQARVRSLNFAG